MRKIISVHRLRGFWFCFCVADYEKSFSFVLIKLLSLRLLGNLHTSRLLSKRLGWGNFPNLSRLMKFRSFKLSWWKRHLRARWLGLNLRNIFLIELLSISSLVWVRRWHGESFIPPQHAHSITKRFHILLFNKTQDNCPENYEKRVRG
jgi:hypothetical protein